MLHNKIKLPKLPKLPELYYMDYINVIHILFVGPLLLYASAVIKSCPKNNNKGLIQLLKFLGIGVIFYHLYKLYNKHKNWLLIALVVLLLIVLDHFL